MRRGESVEALLAEALLRAVRTTSAYGGVLYLRSADGRSLVLSAVTGVPPHLLSAFRHIPVVAPLPVAEAYRTGRTVQVADADDTMRRFPRLAVGLPYVHAFACVPFGADDEPLGVLAVLWPSSAVPPPGAKRQLRATANRLAAALDSQVPAAPRSPVVVPLPTGGGPAPRAGGLDWRLADGRITADPALLAVLGLTPEEFGGRAEELTERLDPADVEPLLAALRADTPFTLRVRLRDGRRGLGLHGRPGRPGTVGVIALDTDAATAAVAAVERLRDGVVALDPDGRISYLNHAAELLLEIGREELTGHHPWSALPWLAEPAYEDRYRSAMLAQQPTAFLACRPPGHWLAFSLYPDAHGLTVRIVPAGPPGAHRAALPEAPPAAPATLGATYHLLQLASALTEAVTVKEVCDCVIDQILPGFDGQEMALYLARSGRMHLVAQTGYPDGFLTPFEGTPVRARLPGTEVFSTGAPAFFESPDELLAAYPGIVQDEMRAWAFLPLVASGLPVGSCILGFDRPRRFTSEERSVLTALGGLIAQALERARLYDAEFALARGLQQALLPHRLPEVPGLAVTARYLPGTRGMEIGGDWYDAISTPAGVCLVIGDVEGHNVGAAATMGQLRSAVRAFVTSGSLPDEVLTRTNQLLLDLDPGLLASCCLIRLDPATGRALAVRAGHVPPLLRRPDGRTEPLDLAGGPLLGIDPDVTYPTTELRLPVGAILALFTDGLIERPGIPLEEGLDQLRADLAHSSVVELGALADHLLRDARHSSHRADDVALLLACRTAGDLPH
ncbi:serine phosphatase RsbU (regulator of sigma subunit)/PAS domain-containing protein [Kitasatospora gansuensis]|uniref:protein-serine/threonine phosphatase n=1 Tax=Kitasatospora gansuensis TaxID=258050 RepID=A0A7W7SH50_9ACTN|nr:SpoIIE family protein phosphatase [Kitasatospora gansuensis]MBB4950282.1 serine phosphatase RsbU (regulator of sigma subunit)/PAS domain-containing protein [Kitasatospora gansuensis]